MEFSTFSFCVALLLAIVCCVYSEEETHELNVAESHQPQKRAVLYSPEDLAALPSYELNKRGSLFRFGKRQVGNSKSDLLEALYGMEPYNNRVLRQFRYGKRDSLSGNEFLESPYGMEGFNKRGSLFRFGKRGSLLRFGRSGPMAAADSPLPSKREIDSFHWGQDTDAE